MHLASISLEGKKEGKSSLLDSAKTCARLVGWSTLPSNSILFGTLGSPELLGSECGVQGEASDLL